MAETLMRLLYVEDDEDIAEIAVMAFQALGNFDVTHCPSGEAAIRGYLKVDPQLIIIDVMMPEMDGPETIAQLKALHGPSIAPFIFMTARVQPHEQSAYRAIGALEVIAKPFDPMTLCDEISKIWDQAHAA